MRLKKCVRLIAAICGMLIITSPAWAQPEDNGVWVRDADFGIHGIHMMLLKTGKVLVLTASRWAVHDPVAGQTGTLYTYPLEICDDPPPPPTVCDQMYCSGHAELPDGRFLIAGGSHATLGSEGHSWTFAFDPDVYESNPGLAAWISVDEIVGPGETRWYPTATTLGNGTILLTAGRDRNDLDTDADEDVPARFDPSGLPGSQWTRLNDPGARKVLHYYPFMFLLADGKVFVGGSAYNYPLKDPSIHLDTYKLNVALEQWESPAVSRSLGQNPGEAAVCYRPDKIMKIGDSFHVAAPEDMVQIIDLSPGTPNPQWATTAALNDGRKYPHMAMLPDGRVIVAGGMLGKCCANQDDVMPAEWYDPDETTPQ